MSQEHEAMLSCACPESDRLMVLCLTCGRVHAFDPSWVFIAAGVVVFVANLWVWIVL